MSIIRSLSVLSALVTALFCVPVFADVTIVETATGDALLPEKQGQSGTFEQYLDQPVADKDKPIELMKVDEDSRVTLGSEDDEDLEAAMRMSY